MDRRGRQLSNLWHLVQLDRRPSHERPEHRARWNKDVDNVIANGPVPASLAGTWRMGANGVPTRFFLGRLAYVVLYGTARTNEQQAQTRRAHPS